MRWGTKNPVLDFKYEQTLASALAVLGASPVIPPAPGSAGYEVAKVRHVVGELKKGELAKSVEEVINLDVVKRALEKLITDPDPDVMEKGLRNVAPIIAALCRASKNPKADPNPTFDASLD